MQAAWTEIREMRGVLETRVSKALDTGRSVRPAATAATHGSGNAPAVVAWSHDEMAVAHMKKGAPVFVL